MNTIQSLFQPILALLATGLLIGCSRPPAQPLTGDYNAASPSSGEAEKPVFSEEAPEEVAAAPAPKPSETPTEAAPPPAKAAEKPGATAAPAEPEGKVTLVKASSAPPIEKPTAAAVPLPQSKKRKVGEACKGETSVASRTSAARSLSPGETDKKALLVVLGEVLVVSHVPEPGTVPYTECLTFIKYKVLAVESGEYRPSELLAVHWGMKDNQLTPAARYRVGEKHRLELEPFDAHPELARVMQADDTNEYELLPYWVVNG